MGYPEHPTFTILLRHQSHLDLQTHAISDYQGVINIKREDIPQRNEEICALLYNKPWQSSTLMEVHVCCQSVPTKAVLDSVRNFPASVSYQLYTT